MIGHSLAALGLSEVEEDTYRALLAVPDCDATSLARTLQVSDHAVRHTLHSLTGHGLAKRMTDDRFAAVAPDSALIDLLSERLEALRSGYVAFGELEQVYRDVQTRNGSMPGSETVNGVEALRSRVDQLQDQARSRVCKLVKPPLMTSETNHDGCDAAVGRGVQFRLVYDRSMLESQSVMRTVRQAAEKGKQVRFAATLPVKLMIVDERVALISESNDHPVALVTEHPSLVQLSLGLFNQVWPTAVPAVGSEPDGAVAGEAGLADPDDRLLLSLLLAGLTDQAIAVRLGVGLRTVQRRVRDLMDAAGVDTRIQLGWQASRKGWVT